MMLLGYRRAATTYQALLLLLPQGFGEQAIAQLRVLFEAMMDLYWMRTHPDVCTERMLAHKQFNGQDWRTKLDRDGDYDGPGPAYEPLDDPKEARALRGEYGSSFTGESLHARVEAWEADATPRLRYGLDGPGQLRWVYNSLVHRANLLVHGSLHGLVDNGERIARGDRGLFYVTKGRARSTCATRCTPRTGASTECCG